MAEDNPMAVLRAMLQCMEAQQEATQAQQASLQALILDFARGFALSEIKIHADGKIILRCAKR